MFLVGRINEQRRDLSEGAKKKNQARVQIDSAFYPRSGAIRQVRSAKERSRVRSPESAGPKKGPGDLSVGPSIWREVVRRIYP